MSALSCGDHGRVMCRVTPNDLFRSVLFVDLVDLAKTTGHRDHIDRGVSAANTNHMFSGDFHRLLVEGIKECHAGHTVGRLFPTLDRQPTAALTPHCPQQRLILSFELLY